MATESIKNLVQGMSDKREALLLERLLTAQLAVNTELTAKFAALLAKLDLDAGVTDEDYASTLTPAPTSTLAK